MTWVVMLTSPDGDTFYGEAIDRKGFAIAVRHPRRRKPLTRRQTQRLASIISA
jgi:hypothetical protein